ncbi:hypothetical protein EJV47_20010 [Hymenobacter gummosus]|uniref:Uncharacterized protein n=1 Tax=Hymenobacter gummosus TaxID=1776032 RepID=A0A3S0QFY7_9BACT|nr:hypothetical protein [Hymenobacter gummosus]RTQ47182.1 hypothetical protein EJV47_20010 [Hymenobacter gummosus]
MKYTLFALTLTAGLGSCQQAPRLVNSNTVAAQAGTAAGPVAESEADARNALRRYISAQPNASLFVVDSAAFVEVNAQWQALVPRTDWQGRMPNRAAFEVDKLTGEVRPLNVK